METAVLLSTVILAYILAGLIHELGHIFVGLIHGWSFRWLVIGPLGITVDQNGKLNFYLEKQMAMWGGVGCIIPSAANGDNLRASGLKVTTGRCAQRAIIIPACGTPKSR